MSNSKGVKVNPSHLIELSTRVQAAAGTPDGELKKLVQSMSDLLQALNALTGVYQIGGNAKALMNTLGDVEDVLITFMQSCGSDLEALYPPLKTAAFTYDVVDDTSRGQLETFLQFLEGLLPAIENTAIS